jgi:alanine racemase
MAYITLNKNNFFYNLDIIAKQTKSKAKIALVLKDNAYGHGLLEMAQLAHEYGITKAVVQTNAEAQKVSAFFDYILVLADIPKEPSPQVRYTINDMTSIEKFPKHTHVELKVNTGMNRNGIEADELEAALMAIENQGLILEGIFTHHGCADELNDFYEMQKENFAMVKKSSPPGLRFHSCNSAALFRDENFDEDIARVGIAAYGCMELPREISEVKLKPVLSIYAKKISSRVVQSGCCIGYGATFRADKKSLVSNYDFGYGDGFLRACSNRFTTKEGLEQVGRISMDNSSFLTDAETICIFSDARDVSGAAGTISYEVLTSLKENIPREIV